MTKKEAKCKLLEAKVLTNTIENKVLESIDDKPIQKQNVCSNDMLQLK